MNRAFGFLPGLINNLINSKVQPKPLSLPYEKNAKTPPSSRQQPECMLNSRRIQTLLRAFNSRFSPEFPSSHFSSLPVLHNLSTAQSHDDATTPYFRKLKYQKPTTIKWAPSLVNNVSLIGHVAMPLRRHESTFSLGVYTVLRVASANSSFRVLLAMWDDMAEMCHEHLKKDDFIYVSGRLRSYTKDDGCGNAMTRYKVKVSELYYVAQPDQLKNCVKNEESQPSRANPGLTDFEGRRNAIYLWQVFFSNPWEWWDNRKTKKHSQMPDFKHKDTGECLWMDHRDPPWVKRQLELLDSKMSDQYHKKEASSPYHPIMWEYDE